MRFCRHAHRLSYDGVWLKHLPPAFNKVHNIWFVVLVVIAYQRS